MSNTIQTPSNQMSGYNNFTHFYAMSRDEVNDLLSYLNTASFIDNIQLLFNTPVENIASLRAYPFDVEANHPAHGSGDNDIIINVVNTGKKGFGLNPLPSPPLNLGSITVPRYHNSFLDYAPYTKVELYLPYIGFVQLDANIVVGNTISIEYVVDYFSGKCTAFISCLGSVIMECDGTIGVDIQIGGGQGAEIARNMLGFAIGAATGAVSLGAGAVSARGSAKTAGAGAGSIASTVGAATAYLGATTINAIQAGQTHISKGGASQPAIGFYAPQQCFLVITRPHVVEPVNYAKYYGRPCGFTYALSALEGYTVVDSIHIDGIGSATADEITEIERLLKAGVIL